MKILILSLGFGLKEHNLFGPLSETFLELANLGHELVVVSRDINSESAKEYYECSQGGSLKVVKLTQPKGMKKYLFPFYIYNELKKLHKIHDFNLVYSHIIPFMTVPALFFKAKYKLKHVYWVCSHWIPEKSFLKNTYNVLVQKNIQKYTDIVLTCTEYCKKNDHEFFSIPLDKYRILPNSVNLKRYTTISSEDARRVLLEKYSIDKSKKIILYFSSLSDRKGAINLVNAVKYIVEKRDDFVILFCGPSANDEIANLTNILKSDGLKKYAIFTGAIEGEDAPIYYNGCDIFCVVPEYEGFGRVFVEASSANKPIVASNVGGIPEVIKDKEDGLLVDHKNYPDIAKSLVKFMEDPEYAKKLAASAYKNVLTKYNVNIVAKNMEKIFLDIIG